MNSPPDPSSPSPSTPSSGSPPPEEAYPSGTGAGSASYLANLTSHIGSAFSGSSASKRRLPTGSSFAAGSTRDAKSRRRGESGRPGNPNWDGLKDNGGKKEKDELIDTALVDYLRKEIGDPFQELPFKG
ncbi:hypothetical protein HYPSUDRAFT_539569 [Hypholoma sublateritium FD-334 SS-4]|uniref:Uncharacterized protein n=1 Tax=Hypholoma sublateritium (strain FD-334 SS-4) TaxID=945553 RepID=A0A0D2P023_HYPSF|nr:hypothetical protein HYPSUDRAFT_539569 [Hypholoma sublateritium FD-334 SS-4]